MMQLKTRQALRGDLGLSDRSKVVLQASQYLF